MKQYLYGLASGILLFLAVLVSFNHYWPSHKDSELLPPAKEIKKVVTITKPCTGIKVYPDKVEKTLGLPEEVRKSPTKDVVASSKIMPDEHPHTVTAVYDSQTMAVSLYDRRDPLPWMTVGTRYTVGVWYGEGSSVKSHVWLLRGDMELVRIKSAGLGLTASVNTDGQAFIGVGGQIRF